MHKTLFLLHTEEYNAEVTDIIKTRVGRTRRVCYVTLNKTALAVKQSLFHEKIEYSRYYFIDAVTPRLFSNFMLENCTFIKDMSDMSKLVDAIITAIKMHMADLVVIDSLSTLLTYSSEKDVTAFIECINGYLDRMRVELFIIASYSDRDRPCMRQIANMTDETVLPKKRTPW